MRRKTSKNDNHGVKSLRDLFSKVRDKRISIAAALREAPALPFRDLGFAKVDHHRAIRCGFPEVILCEGKRPEDIKHIARELLKGGSHLLATRANPAAYRAIRLASKKAVYHKRARAVTVGKSEPVEGGGSILIVTAGTADIPVAEEARVTVEAMGSPVDVLYDVGVAGIHRLLENAEQIFSANVIVVVAGMEGALASVVGGLTDRPVIAVPTSVGYGASFEGLAPLLTMLNSCAAGVSVVNIDNGFGGGYMAALIHRSAVSPKLPGRSRRARR
ncbi:MAG: nickel pincer cofactor biosynthesis protein LarB [Planctomycetota bacterium]|nr:nickel pincer cofactor biosynthesis protein LarB [Planctomycetota bacterium]